jgi:uncharacterized membrane protein HdeD (DUF308 family)
MIDFEHSLAAILQGSWWTLLLRGLGSFAVGILLWVHPVIAISTLVLLFAVALAADGLLAVWAAVAGRAKHDDWWVLMIGGLLSLCIAVMTIAVPALTATALLFFVAIWAVAAGVLNILAGLRVRTVIVCGNILILIGALGVIFGGLIMAHPAAGMRAVLWLPATYALVHGAFLTLLSFRARIFAKMLAKKANG